MKAIQQNTPAMTQMFTVSAEIWIQKGADRGEIVITDRRVRFAAAGPRTVTLRSRGSSGYSSGAPYIGWLKTKKMPQLVERGSQLVRFRDEGRRVGVANVLANRWV